MDRIANDDFEFHFAIGFAALRGQFDAVAQ
jgi:hypothetical protein